MTRRVTALAAMALLASLILLDLRLTMPNPYAAPPLLALGSGVAQSGGFCAVLPE